MYGTSDPVVFQALPQYTSNLFVRTKAESQPEEVLARVESVFKKDNPGYPFTYQFVDQQFDELFRAESLISRLSRLFAALAVFISCLGLFGLASFTAERRTKEIGIRKVLGASSVSLAALLSRDFLRLVFLSALISFPVAWWAMHNWLQGYAYRISISGWVFVGAGVAAVLIALATISFQAIRAALTNPVKSLRTE
jgi:ABC-type antimicrobial peptide transport system permease subunit